MALVNEDLSGKGRCRPIAEADGDALAIVAVTRARRRQKAYVTAKIDEHR